MGKAKTISARDALHTVIYEARTERVSRASYLRIMKAGKALGLGDDDQRWLLDVLEVHNRFRDPHMHTGGRQ